MGLDVNVKNNSGLTPLHYAAMNYFSRYSNLDIVGMLIEKGADVNAKDQGGNAPIHTPANNCNFEMVQLLIAKGAEVNAQNGEGQTPLHLTSSNGQFECVNLLLENGADISAKTKDGQTAADLARKNGHVELADGLDKVVGNSSEEKPEEKPVDATGGVELNDSAQDMGPITTSGGEEAPLDVVQLSIKSDGKVLTFAATLNDPPGRFATSPVTAYIDTDNNPATGAKIGSNGPSGFEYEAELSMCIKYSDGMEACSGGSTDGKPTERHGAVDLAMLTGESNYDSKEDVVDSMGFPGRKASVKVPVNGKVVEAPIEYADLKVKPGQTIRILARETGGSPTDGDGYFPIVLLTLK